MTGDEYLISRGIHPEVAHFAKWEKVGEQYRIPYFSALGVEVGHRWHNPHAGENEPRYMSVTGSKNHLYLVENVIYPQVLICEGEVDALSALSAGLKAVGSIGVGGFNLAWSYLMEHCDDVVIAFDNDKTGKQRGLQLAQKLTNLPVRVLHPPDKGSDINSMLNKYGPKTVHDYFSKGMA